MSLGVIEIEAKTGIHPIKPLPHRGKTIFIPHGGQVILGRTCFEFAMRPTLGSGRFRLCTVPKNELVHEIEISAGEKGQFDLHPYWFTLSVMDVTDFFRGA